MLDCYSTNATVAKIRAIHGNMLTRENYHEMLSRRSVSEIADYLASTRRFREAFRDVDPNTVHRGFLEALLQKENFDTYIKLCRFQGLDKVGFYDFLIRKTELNCILLLINSINTGLDKSYLNDLPGYVLKHSKINLLELSRAQSYEDLLKLLRGTHYYKVLVRVAPMEDGSIDYTECELRLRSEYYENMLEQIKKSFSSNDAAELDKMIGVEINCLNIINAYRMKAFFGYTSEQIKKRQVMIAHHSSRSMEKYYELETPQEMLEWLGKRGRGRDYSDGEFLEKKINGEKYNRLSHEIYRSVSAPVVLYAFVALCDIEVANIVHIIEGIRYGVDPAFIEKNLLIC